MPTHYRIIEYVGDQDWLDKQLDNSIHGVKAFSKGRITVADIDLNDSFSIEFVRSSIRALVAKIIDNRAATHDAAHGTYFPGVCEECLALGWIDSNGAWTPPSQT